MNEATIHIEPDGKIYGVYSDDLAQAFQGCPMEIKRASEVEFSMEHQQWEVHFLDDPAGHIAFAADTRSACIAWEVEQLNERLAKL